MRKLQAVVPSTVTLIYVWLALSIGAVGLLGWLSLAYISRITSVETREVTQNEMVSQKAFELQAEVQDEVLALRSYLIATQPGARTRLLTDWNRHHQALTVIWQDLQRVDEDEDERQMLAKLHADLAEYQSYGASVMRFARDDDKAAWVELYESEGKRLQLKLFGTLSALIQKQQLDNARLHAGISSANQGLRRLLTLIVLLIVPSLALMAAYVLHRLVPPLRRLETAALQIGTGATGVQVPEGSPDELGAVARAFNLMATRVETTLAQLERANADLRALDRAKDEFLGVTSHELRTPLNFITGFCSLLEDEVVGPLTPDQRRCLAGIDEGAVRLLSLVDELLVFAAWRNGRLALDPHDIPIEPLIAQAVHGVEAGALQKGIRLMAELRTTCQVHADASLLRQAVSHLLANAIKFTPTGGRVDVRIYGDAEGVNIEVQDTGVGITAEDLPRLFGVFRQLDMSPTRRDGGLGLGLGLAKAIVEAHAGVIGVRSEPGRGSTFWLRLPCSVARDPLALS